VFSVDGPHPPQRPLVLKGHTRPISQIQFSREGDLLFSSGIDATVTLWRTSNGERVGNYKGHGGTVTSFDVDGISTPPLTSTHPSAACTRLYSGSLDSSVRVWDVQTGDVISTLPHPTGVTSVALEHGAKLLATAIAPWNNNPVVLSFYDVSNATPTPVAQFPIGPSKVQKILFAPLGDAVIVASEDGAIRVIDVANGAVKQSVKDHSGAVMDLAFAANGMTFISASKDHTARVGAGGPGFPPPPTTSHPPPPPPQAVRHPHPPNDQILQMRQAPQLRLPLPPHGPRTPPPPLTASPHTPR
jgi:translation initiation factor 3 subunit I